MEIVSWIIITSATTAIHCFMMRNIASALSLTAPQNGPTCNRQRQWALADDARALYYWSTPHIFINIRQQSSVIRGCHSPWDNSRWASIENKHARPLVAWYCGLQWISIAPTIEHGRYRLGYHGDSGRPYRDEASVLPFMASFHMIINLHFTESHLLCGASTSLVVSAAACLRCRRVDAKCTVFIEATPAMPNRA